MMFPASVRMRTRSLKAFRTVRAEPRPLRKVQSYAAVRTYPERPFVHGSVPRYLRTFPAFLAEFVRMFVKRTAMRTYRHDLLFFAAFPSVMHKLLIHLRKKKQPYTHARIVHDPVCDNSVFFFVVNKLLIPTCI